METSPPLVPVLNRQYESMTRIHVHGWTVRVWRTETQLTAGPNQDVCRALHRAKLLQPGRPLSVTGIAAALDTLPNVAAYEILDANNNGALVYPDWK